MSKLDNLDKLFVVWAFLFQIVLIVHFALRKPFDCLRTMYPSRCNQCYSLARWKKLVILAGRFPFPSLCCFWLLGRLCSKNSMAKPAALVDNVSLRVFISSHSYVLLVAACPSSSPTVVCIRNTVCHRDHFEYHLSLNCEMVLLFFAGLPMLPSNYIGYQRHVQLPSN